MTFGQETERVYSYNPRVRMVTRPYVHLLNIPDIFPSVPRGCTLGYSHEPTLSAGESSKIGCQPKGNTEQHGKKVYFYGLIYVGPGPQRTFGDCQSSFFTGWMFFLSQPTSQSIKRQFLALKEIKFL